MGLDARHAVHAARVLGLAAVILPRGQAGFGGTSALLGSALLETVVALLQSPVRMLAYSFFVLVALTGWKLEWKSPPREAEGIRWADAMRKLAPMTAVIVLHAVGIAAIQLGALIWLAPITLPLLLAVPLAVLISNVALGGWVRARGVLLIPEESRSPAVLRRAWQHAAAAT